MKNQLLIAIVMVTCSSLNPLMASSIEKTVYGLDDRVESEKHPDALLRDYSDSVAAMVRDYRLLDRPQNDFDSFEDYSRELYDVLGEEFIRENEGLLNQAYENYLINQSISYDEHRSSLESNKDQSLDGFFYFDLNRTLARNQRVCKQEPFSQQPVLSQCTGFLVSDDLLVTAGHCVESRSQCDSFKWVFDYKDGIDKIAEKDVYGCEKIVSSELTEGVFSTKDYALIKLDRKVTDREPLPVRTSGYVDLDEPLAIIGHPSGLPMKTADNATVTRRRINFFYSNLDTFSGNSGSPVINLNTGLVEGLLIQGAQDYVDKGRCRVSRLMSKKEEDEEKVFRLPRLKDLEDYINKKIYY